MRNTFVLAALLAAMATAPGCRDSDDRDDGYPPFRANPEASENVDELGPLDENDRGRASPDREAPGTNPNDGQFNSPLAPAAEKALEPNGDGDAMDGE